MENNVLQQSTMMLMMSMIMKNEQVLLNLILDHMHLLLLFGIGYCLFQCLQLIPMFQTYGVQKILSMTFTSSRILNSTNGIESLQTCDEVKALTNIVISKCEYVHSRQENWTNIYNNNQSTVLLLKSGVYPLEDVQVDVSWSEKIIGLTSKMEYVYCLSSTVLNSQELQMWMQDKSKRWKSNLAIGNATKLFSFSHKKQPDGSPLAFEKQDLCSNANRNNETFDFIFGEQKQNIIRLLDRLQNKSWYKQHGDRRKEGLMLAGVQGTGKTKIAIATALYLRRHLIIIDLKRIRTIQELETILNVDSIDDIEIKHDNTVFLFEEFSMKHSSFSCNDSLDLNAFLSVLDGPRLYDGTLFVATTNAVDLDQRLTRDGRFTLFQFDYPSAAELQAFFQIHYPNDTTVPLETIIKWQEKLQNKCSFAQAMTLVKISVDFQDLLKQF